MRHHTPLTLLLTLTLALCLLAGVGWGADWYVRPSEGEYGTENGTDYDNAFDGWAGITWGAGGVSAGDTLWVAGTFTGEYINITASGTSGNQIIIDGGYSGDPGVIDNNQAHGKVIRLNTASYLTFQNLTITNSTAVGIGGGTIGAGLELKNLIIHTGPGTGVAHGGFTLIEDVTVYDFAQSGLQITESDNVIIRNVYVRDCGTDSQNLDGIFVGNGSTNFLVTNCTVENQKGQSAFDSSPTGVAGGEASGKFTYCMAINAPPNGFKAAGIGVDDTVSFQYCIVDGGEDCTWGFLGSGAGTVEFLNCVNYNAGTSALFFFEDSGTRVAKNCIAVGTTYCYNILDNTDLTMNATNCIGSTTMSWGKISGVGKSLAEMQAAGYFANSLDADPLFTSATTGDFTLQASSPCIDTGTDLGDDYDIGFAGLDQDEHGSGWEIGAYVYDAPATGRRGWSNQFRGFSSTWTGSW